MARLREEWQQKAQGWIEFTTDDPFYNLFNKPAFLDLLPPPGQLTLDVGCGEGRLAVELASNGHRVVAVDGAPTLARNARTAGVDVCVGDAALLPLADRIADLVVCFMVLMDVDELDLCLAELARVLAPGGVLCVAILHPIITSGLFVPNDPNLTFYMGEYRQPMHHVLDVRRPSGQVFQFHIEHHPLEDYSLAFEAAGLAITALREPTPRDEVVATRPEFANYQRVPNFLHIRAEHRSGQLPLASGR